MELHVNQWGNSLGMRLPKALVKQFGIRNGSTLIVSPDDSGGFKVIPKKRGKRRRYTLEELLAQATPENRPEYIEWKPVGKEIISDDWS